MNSQYQNPFQSKGQYRFPYSVPPSHYLNYRQPFLADEPPLSDFAANHKKAKYQKKFSTKMYTNRVPKRNQPPNYKQASNSERSNNKDYSSQSTGIQVWPCLNSEQSKKAVHIVVRNENEQDSDLSSPPSIHSVCPTCSHLVEAVTNYHPDAQHVEGPTGIVALPLQTGRDIKIGKGEFEWDPLKSCWKMILPVFPKDILPKIKFPDPPAVPPDNYHNEISHSFTIIMDLEETVDKNRYRCVIEGINKNEDGCSKVRPQKQQLTRDFAKSVEVREFLDSNQSNAKMHRCVFKPAIKVMNYTNVVTPKTQPMPAPFVSQSPSSSSGRPTVPSQGLRFVRPYFQYSNSNSSSPNIPPQSVKKIDDDSSHKGDSLMLSTQNVPTSAIKYVPSLQDNNKAANCSSVKHSSGIEIQEAGQSEQSQFEVDKVLLDIEKLTEMEWKSDEQIHSLSENVKKEPKSLNCESLTENILKKEGFNGTDIEMPFQELELNAVSNDTSLEPKSLNYESLTENIVKKEGVNGTEMPFQELELNAVSNDTSLESSAKQGEVDESLPVSEVKLPNGEMTDVPKQQEIFKDDVELNTNSEGEVKNISENSEKQYILVCDENTIGDSECSSYSNTNKEQEGLTEIISHQEDIFDSSIKQEKLVDSKNDDNGGTSLNSEIKVTDSNFPESPPTELMLQDVEEQLNNLEIDIFPKSMSSNNEMQEIASRPEELSFGNFSVADLTEVFSKPVETVNTNSDLCSNSEEGKFGENVTEEVENLGESMVNFISVAKEEKKDGNNED